MSRASPSGCFFCPLQQLRQHPFPKEITKILSLSWVTLAISQAQRVPPLLAPSLGFFHHFREDFCSL